MDLEYSEWMKRASAERLFIVPLVLTGSHATWKWSIPQICEWNILWWYLQVIMNTVGNPEGQEIPSFHLSCNYHVVLWHITQISSRIYILIISVYFYNTSVRQTNLRSSSSREIFPFFPSLCEIVYPAYHGRLARWYKWRACDVGKTKEGLENVLWLRWSNGRVGEWAVM